MNSIVIPNNGYLKLRRHLFSNNGEQVAFLFSEEVKTDHLRSLSVKDIYLVPQEELRTSSHFHVELAEIVRPKIIKRAWDSGTLLIEAHSHLTGRHEANFSGSDIAGLSEFVPHVLWRLPGRPYGALVFSKKTFDSLLWIDRFEEPELIDKLEIGENKILCPTGLTLRTLKTLE